MDSTSRVVWSEGLFLRGQHFQQMERFAECQMRASLHASPLPAYGFGVLALDESALEAGKISLSSAAGVFPDGTPFRIGSNCPAPAALSIDSDASGPVLLAIPAQSSEAANIAPQHLRNNSARWQGVVQNVLDQTMGTDGRSEEIEVAELQLRLLAPDAPTDGFTTLSVILVEGLSADGRVLVSESHLPPSLTISALPWYERFLGEVETGLSRIADTHGELVRGKVGRSLENLLILEAANASLPRIAHLKSFRRCHPADLFAELAGIAGRLATFGAADRRVAKLPDYDHSAPGPAMFRLRENLRSLMLSLRHVEQKSRALSVAHHSENVWKIRLGDSDLVEKSRIILVVDGEMSDSEMRRLFVERTTVGAADEFERLWRSKLTGIALLPLNSQPRDIPYEGERLCLELDPKSPSYAALKESPGFVVGVAGRMDSRPRIQCYAVSK